MEGFSEVKGADVFRDKSAISGNNKGSVTFGWCSRSFGGDCWGRDLGGSLLEETEALECRGTPGGSGRGRLRPCIGLASDFGCEGAA